MWPFEGIKWPEKGRKRISKDFNHLERFPGRALQVAESLKPF
jgi:hypothetical protein